MIFTNLEVFLIMMYVILANSWAIFAITMNNLFHREEPSILQIVQCYLYNVVGFPLALWLAIYKTDQGAFNHHIKHPGTDEKIATLSSKLNEVIIENTRLKDACAKSTEIIEDAINE